MVKPSHRWAPHAQVKVQAVGEAGGKIRRPKLLESPHAAFEQPRLFQAEG